TGLSDLDRAALVEVQLQRSDEVLHRRRERVRAPRLEVRRPEADAAGPVAREGVEVDLRLTECTRVQTIAAAESVGLAIGDERRIDRARRVARGREVHPRSIAGCGL